MGEYYCYKSKQERNKKKDDPNNRKNDEVLLRPEDMKFCFKDGEIVENEDYKPDEYMQRVYAKIREGYARLKKSEEESADKSTEIETKPEVQGKPQEKYSSPADELPEYIQNMPYGELLKKFPGGIEEALEFEKNQKISAEPEVHYNSPEPEKFGAKAFTKGSEIYLSSGAEDSLEHEIAHYYQQMEGKVRPTGEINGEKVNTNPKLEQEADEMDISVYNFDSIQKQPAYDAVMQFEKLSREELSGQLETEANSQGVFDLLSDATRNNILDKAEQHTPGWVFGRGTALDNVIKPELQKIKSIVTSAETHDVKHFLTKENVDEILNKIANRSYFTSEATAIDAEIKRLKETNINSSFSKGVFEKKNIVNFREVKTTKSLEDAKSQGLLNDDQCETIKSYILRLTKCCDDKGITSVFQGANENASPGRVMLNFDSTEADPETSQLADCFVKRLEQMTAYIEKVSKEIDSDGTAFGEKYWIRSTGSDPHKEGEHALFFVNKVNQEGYEADPRKRAGEVACVYKAHDLKPDAAVVGKEGMFARVNEIVRNDFIVKSTRLGLVLEESPENALATMQINADKHTEELVAKKKEMTPEEAKLYFFRGGILKALTDAMAVIDLHGDNIMPTEKGPMIIDAEIDFFHYGLDSCLTGAFSSSFIGDRLPVSIFTIIGGGAGNTNISSADAFQNIESEYYKIYEQGRKFMMEQMKSKQETFASEFEKQLRKIDKVRILPLATSDFARYLQDTVEMPGEKHRIANELTDKIKDELTKENVEFLDSGKTKVELFEEHLKLSLLTTFENGTIPAMYADMEGNIYLDNEKVGEIHLKEGEMVIAGAIGKEKLIKIMKECFVKIIDN